VFDLEQELRGLLDAFDAAGVEYALCGGLALGVHGFPRATIDIDILIRPEAYPRAEEVAGSLGFVVKAKPMNFSGGATRINRISKIDRTDGELLMLDLLLVTPACEDVWAGRQHLRWQDRDLWVVSREGLIALKMLRMSDQDRLDIERLRQPE
jgi:hypothetical protein